MSSVSPLRMTWILSVRWPLAYVLATLTANCDAAGEPVTNAALPLLPAEATTTMPARTALSVTPMALSTPSAHELPRLMLMTSTRALCPSTGRPVLALTAHSMASA